MSDQNTSSAVGNPPARWRRQMVVVTGLVAAMLSYLGWSFAPTSIRPVPIPTPNGYDDLIGAARSIVGTPPKFKPQFAQIVRPSDGPVARQLDPMNFNWEEAGAYLLANREVLARARVGLGRECVVPVAFEPGYAHGSNPNRDALKALGQLWLWEAKVAIHEGKDADAAQSFLDMVRLGQAASRSGLVVDAWAGLDIETGGLLGLHRLAKDLDPTTCRRAIGVLRDFDRSREPYRAFRDRQASSQIAEQGRFRSTVFDLSNARTLMTETTYLDESYREAIAMTRLVRVELALQVYRSEAGDNPARLDDLVPSILPEVPLDPFTGGAPIYRKTKGRYQLYSVGPDLIDDNGSPPRRAPRTRASGDILPDSIGTTLIP